jgi:hypothetical protein
VQPIPGLSSCKFFVPLLILALACAVSVKAQSPATPLIAQAMIAGAIDEAKLVTLHGNVHPLAQARYDLGTVPDSLAAERILLLLNRPVERQTALQQFMKDVHTRGSASYHQWLTPQQFGERFGPADSDVQLAVGWLKSHGFKVARVTKSKGLIEFSGTAGQLRQALHTQIHQYNIHGETHYANANEISIPAALAPLVRGISPLNNFRAQPQLQVLGRASYSPTTKKTTPEWTLPNGNTNFYAVAPEDFVTQYDLAPLYQAGVNGTGQTIGIINESNIDISLVSAYQQLFGLPSNPTQVVIDGDDPGLNGADVEAYLDVEVSGAVAPNATVNLYISNGSDFQDPVALSALRAIEDNQASVLSMSFGACEYFEGNSGNQLWSELWEEAAAQGQTVFVSSGDSGSAGCDPANLFPASFGLAVNGMASTPWNVAVGGTDFYYSDYATGAASAATLWNQTNDSNLGSLKVPLPEQVWNDYFGLDAVDLYPGNNGAIAAGGGASSCAVQSSNTCTSGYAKPSWQTGTGVPADGVRDVPDVSLFASNGANMSAFAICPFQGECAPGSDNTAEIYLVGGTSASSPAMAGIMALIDQKYGRQGQANFTIYPLSQQKPSAFHDVTLGNNNVNCTQGSPHCSLDSNGDGFYTLQEYSAAMGYDLASGLGSLDANVLVSNWNSVTFLPTATTLHLSAASIPHGTPITVTTTVAPASGSGVPTGGVAILTTSPLPDSQGQTSISLSGGTGSQSVDFFPGGSYQVTAQYGGDGVYGGSTSTPVALKVTPENANINFQVINGQTQTPITTGGTLSYTTPFTLNIEPIGVSAPTGMANGNATGTATFTVDSMTAIVPMNGEGVASWTPPALALGNHTVSATYSGDSSFKSSSTTSPVTFSVTKGYASLRADFSGLFSLGSETVDVNVGGSLTAVAMVTPYIGFTPAAGFAAPTGTVTICLGGDEACSAPNYSQTVPLVSPSGNNAPDSSTTVTFTNLAAGEYILTALYNGDANWLSQEFLGSGDYVYVAPLPTLTASTTTLNISPTTISGDQLTTFTITVTGSGGVAPTGGVYCYSNGILIVNDALTPATSGATSSATFQIGQGWFWNNGANPMTAVYYGDSNYQPSSSNTVTVNVTQTSTADFTLSPQQPQITMQSGGSGTVGVNLASLNSFNGVVSLACTPSSADITCSVNPASPTLNGVATATVTINSTAQPPATSRPSRSGLAGWMGAGGTLICAFVLLGGLSDGKRKYRLRALSLFAALALSVSCGGSSGSPPPPPPPPTAATYSVVVSGTANGIVHNAKVLVVVQ